MLRIVLGRGWRRLRRQTWVLAESGRMRHSHESTGTDGLLTPQTTHPLTPTHTGPIASDLSQASPASHPKSTSPWTNEKRHNLVFDDTIRQDGPPRFDLCRDVQFWPSEQIRYPPPFPKDSSLFESFMLFFPPFLSTHGLSPLRPSPLNPGLLARLNHYPIDIISRNPKFPLFPSFTRCSQGF